jgi:hypothetical protein
MALKMQLAFLRAKLGDVDVEEVDRLGFSWNLRQTGDTMTLEATVQG